MKLLFDANKLLVFFNKIYIKDIDITERKVAKKFLKSLIKKLHNKYGLEFAGYYDVNIYIDKLYGIVISIENDELDYLDCFNNQIEMDIKFIETSFLYKLEEIIDDALLSKFYVYKNKYSFYLKPKENISDSEMSILLENSKIIFNDKVTELISKSEIMRG